MQADPGASVMAGGTDLLVQYRAGIKRPSAFIDIKRIPDLIRFSIDSSGLTLGAAVLLLVSVSFAATLIPASRAARLEPMSALREE